MNISQRTLTTTEESEDEIVAMIVARDDYKDRAARDSE